MLGDEEYPLTDLHYLRVAMKKILEVVNSLEAKKITAQGKTMYIWIMHLIALTQSVPERER